jgi:hypothetical protein
MTANVPDNPFGVMDVPDPYDTAVIQFANTAVLDGAPGDDNAIAWTGAHERDPHASLEGEWQSPWNGAADPTNPGDAAGKGKQSAGELKLLDGRVYLKFNWNGGVRKGLIEARREGAKRLVGKYINLSNPDITRPWIGLIVGTTASTAASPKAGRISAGNGKHSGLVSSQGSTGTGDISDAARTQRPQAASVAGRQAPAMGIGPPAQA